MVWAAFFNFVAAFTFGTAVAKTMGWGWSTSRWCQPGHPARLISAIVWDLLTGGGARSRRALIGGYAGAAVARRASAPSPADPDLHRHAHARPRPQHTLMTIILIVVRRWTPARVNIVFRRLQLLSAAACSLGRQRRRAEAMGHRRW